VENPTSILLELMKGNGKIHEKERKPGRDPALYIAWVSNPTHLQSVPGVPGEGLYKD